MRPRRSMSSTLKRGLLLPHDLEAAKRDAVTGLQNGFLHHLPVYCCSIGTACIPHDPPSSLLHKLGMVPRHAPVVEHDIIVGQPAHGGGRPHDRVTLAVAHDTGGGGAYRQWQISVYAR